MMEQLIALFRKFNHLILYGLIGSLSAGLDFCVFSVLTSVTEFPYMWANCISVLCGISCSFCLNRNINFKVKDHTSRRFSLFLTIGLCGLLLSNTILFVTIDELGLHRILAKLISVVVVALLQFIANKYITFKHTTDV